MAGESSGQHDAPIIQLQRRSLPRKPNHTATLQKLIKRFFKAEAGFDGVSLSVLLSWLGRQPKAPADLSKQVVVHRALCWLHEHDTILAYRDGSVHNRMS